MQSDCTDHGQKGTQAGYGSYWWEGRKGLAHRREYARSVGKTREELEGVVVRHRCDNPRCVNPAHLEEGSHKDNVADCIIRGRRPKPGEDHYNARLSDEDVATIRARYRPRCPVNGQTALAKEFGVTQPHVSAIISNKERAA